MKLLDFCEFYFSIFQDYWNAYDITSSYKKHTDTIINFS
jgi:hypothetical protein